MAERSCAASMGRPASSAGSMLCAAAKRVSTRAAKRDAAARGAAQGAASDRLRSEEHTSELQSLMRISYAVFCLKKKRSDVARPYAITYHKLNIQQQQ